MASPACRAPGGAVSPLGHDAPSRTRRGQSRPVVTERRVGALTRSALLPLVVFFSAISQCRAALFN